MGLGSNFNVYGTCLQLLRQRGFSLHVEGELGPDECYPPDHLWYAEKGGISRYADNPIELLGLAELYEHHQPKEDTPYWWRIEGEDIRDELYEVAWPSDDDTDGEQR